MDILLSLSPLGVRFSTAGSRRLRAELGFLIKKNAKVINTHHNKPIGTVFFELWGPQGPISCRFSAPPPPPRQVLPILMTVYPISPFQTVGQLANLPSGVYCIDQERFSPPFRPQRIAIGSAKTVFIVKIDKRQ